MKKSGKFLGVLYGLAATDDQAARLTQTFGGE
jgi:hypothetical protein